MHSIRITTLILLAALIPAAEAETELPSLLGLQTSTGAAEGYVPDTACKHCHAAKYESYQHVGMARSFARPQQAGAIERFGQEFFHQPSQRHYQIRRAGKDLIFRRYQRDDDGNPINVFETRVDWVLGSGNRARSYLYQTEAGELYELPLGWYSESHSWGMSPGFESADHPGVQRQVKKQCMFCHNAFPQVPAGSDGHWQEETFPHDLPQGTGCQRCHGPGAAHIRAVLSGAGLEEIHARIVNPRKLPPERRDSVCFQCHMLPAVTIVGARRFERSIYSFRPGQLLSDYLVHVDIEEAHVPRTERFEINHHGYRLWQSSCYRQSQGELACISCHDPHVKPQSKAFRAQVADVCRDCHQDWTERHSQPVARTGCVGCHMPTRRTHDVVEVTMTDHRIAGGPFDAEELIKPVSRREPVITEIELLALGQPPSGAEKDLYRLIAALRAYPDRGAIAALRQNLSHTANPNPVPYLELLRAQLKSHAFASAEQTARLALERRPNLFRIHTWLGLAQLGQGENLKAVKSLEQSITLQPTAEAYYNLAIATQRLGRFELAEEAVHSAISLRPNMHVALRLQGQIHAQRGNLQAARVALTRALEIDPGDGPVYADLVRVLRRMGQTDQAQRFLAVGMRVARDRTILDTLRESD